MNSFIEKWEHFFKPDVRQSGLALATKGVVSLSHPSDTEIQSFVRSTAGYKVILKSESVSSDGINSSCTCPQFLKGQFCKHIWAVLLEAEKKHPDFFDAKIGLHRLSPPITAKAIKKMALTESQVEFQLNFKLKQNEHRKEQYQKQKLKLKERKKNQKKKPSQFQPDVEEAFLFFQYNGFSLKDDFSMESLTTALKKLARVFHPDAGGSHSEIVALNSHADTLRLCLKR